MFASFWTLQYYSRYVSLIDYIYVEYDGRVKTKNDRRQSAQSEIFLDARHELIEKLAQSTLRHAGFHESIKSELLFSICL